MIIIKGNSKWAKVFEPDTRFVPEGEYSIQVVMPEAESVAVCEQLETLVDQEYDKSVKEKPALKANLSKRAVFEKEVDQNGNETGNVVFKTKLKAAIKSKDGRVYHQKVSVVDTKKQPLDPATAVGNGSLVKVAVEPFPYMMQSTKQVGVSLRLKAVQVIDLVEYGNVADAFDEEDGYVANAKAKDDSNDVFNDETTDDTDDAEGDF